jgi:polyvinyl alcohol dehydrogenase (cytochrome)
MRGTIRVAVRAAALPVLGQDGAAIFEKSCAGCHKAANETRAPLPEALATLPLERIVTSLESGAMKEQAAALSRAEHASVSAFLTAGVARTDSAAGRCADGVKPAAGAYLWNGWGVDAAHTRFQPAKMAGLTASDVPKLKLKWAFGFPNAVAAIAQPVVADGRLYFGSLEGAVYSADARSGCVYWTFGR